MRATSGVVCESPVHNLGPTANWFAALGRKGRKFKSGDSNPSRGNPTSTKLKSSPRLESRAYAAWLGRRLRSGDLELWLSLRWIAIDTRVLTRAPSIEDAR